MFFITFQERSGDAKPPDSNEQLLWKQNNFKWPSQGMSCYVPNCPDTKLFVAYRKFIKHWAAVHKEYIIKHKCDVCGHTLAKHSKPSHRKLKHKAYQKVQKLTFTHVHVPNPNYIDPGSVIPPSPPDVKVPPEIKVPPDVKVPPEIKVPPDVKLPPEIKVPPDIKLPPDVKVPPNVKLPPDVKLKNFDAKPPHPVSNEEKNNFKWPSLGMCCHVPNCPEMKLFVTYYKFIDHWVGMHREYIIKHKCDVCGHIIAKNSKTNHRKQRHKAYQKLTFTHEHVPSQNYIDPGSVIPPAPPDVKLRDFEVEDDPQFEEHKKREIARKRIIFSAFSDKQQTETKIVERSEKSLISGNEK